MASQPEPFPGTYPGTIGTPPDLPGMFENSELVAVAEVEYVTDHRPVTYLVRDQPVGFTVRRADVKFAEVYKGRPESEVVEFLQPDAPASFAGLTTEDRVVLFLNRSGDHYHLADWSNGAVPADAATIAELEAL